MPISDLKTDANSLSNHHLWGQIFALSRSSRVASILNLNDRIQQLRFIPSHAITKLNAFHPVVCRRTPLEPGLLISLFKRWLRRRSG